MKQRTNQCPDYYIGAIKGIESMDVVLDFQGDNYNLGTALTYIMRAGKKPNNPMAQDIKKAIDHLQAELDRISALEEKFMSSLEEPPVMIYKTNPE